jgi:hypothetical protein
MGAVLTLLVLVFQLAAAQSSPSTDARVLGTWQLNVAKSKFFPGPPYRDETRTYEPYKDAVKMTIKRTLANGQSLTIEYTAGYDSMEYPVSGSADYDTIRLKKLDSLTFEGVLSHADNVIAVTRRVISDDGKTMTITFKAKELQGRPVDNTMVYDRR